MFSHVIGALIFVAEDTSGVLVCGIPLEVGHTPGRPEVISHGGWRVWTTGIDSSISILARNPACHNELIPVSGANLTVNRRIRSCRRQSNYVILHMEGGGVANRQYAQVWHQCFKNLLPISGITTSYL